MDVALHESLFECATTAWISADAFISEKLEFRKPAINSCLEIAAASAAVGKTLFSDACPLIIGEFRDKLEKGIRVLDQHCQEGLSPRPEHCIITLKCWRQMKDLLNALEVVPGPEQKMQL